MQVEDVRRIALALPETLEYEHGGLPAFRVRGRRFASMLDDDGVNLALGEQGVLTAAARWPDACRVQHFGARVASLRVDFTRLPDPVVTDLIVEAWASRAPKRLVAGLNPPTA